MLLTGSFGRVIDEKQRLAIPKRLREAMGVSNGGALYLAPSTDQSLSLYTEEAFASLAARLEQVSPTRRDVRAFVRLFYARAQRVELDSQGRVRVPQELAALARLEKEVILLAVQDHLELWSAELWQQYLDEKLDHYDEFAETAFGGAGPAEEPASAMKPR
ncbi:MAG: division/cell wall cluster transcriptional repressor MraZ [Thermoguttaceae bacterium]|jgi:MraZ protein|nr:division/cell wall cluster transcriptional repressor MraZ [Thermoguttaceae bacterium]